LRRGVAFRRLPAGSRLRSSRRQLVGSATTWVWRTGTSPGGWTNCNACHTTV
jgi:hypothetical protein